MQDGLAGDSERLGGLLEREVSVWDLGHEPAANLVGETDAPRSIGRDLLAWQQALPAPSARARARASRGRLLGRQSTRPTGARRYPCRSPPPPTRGGREARSRTPASPRPPGPARPRDRAPPSDRPGSATARAPPADPLRPRSARAQAPSRARLPCASPRSRTRAPLPSRRT